MHHDEPDFVPAPHTDLSGYLLLPDFKSSPTMPNRDPQASTPEKNQWTKKDQQNRINMHKSNKDRKSVYLSPLIGKPNESPDLFHLCDIVHRG